MHRNITLQSWAVGRPMQTSHREFNDWAPRGGMYRQMMRRSPTMERSHPEARRVYTMCGDYAFVWRLHRA